jgi:hypothetical protein
MSREWSVYVNGAAIVLLPLSLTRSATNDLMNSVLLAQLVANKRVEASYTSGWYEAYVSVLDDFWLRNVKIWQDFQLDEDNPASPLEWASALLVRGNEVEARAVSALESVAQLPGSSPGMSVFRKHVQKVVDGDQTEIASQSNSVRLLVIVAHDNTSMTCVCLQFKTRQAIGENPCGQRFNAKDIDGHVSAHLFDAQLFETLYAPAREAIARKVKEASSDNIVDVTEA